MFVPGYDIPPPFSAPAPLFCSSPEVPPHLLYLKDLGFKPFTPVPITTPERCEIMTEEDEENARRFHQAKLAQYRKSEATLRLSGLLGEDQAIKYPGLTKSPMAAARDASHEFVRLLELKRLQANPWVVLLPEVLLIQERDGEFTRGVLEARGSGFTFTSPDIHVHFKDTCVSQSFLRRGDSMDPYFVHFLQFHLRQPMMVGTKETKDIMFCAVSPELQKTSIRFVCNSILRKFGDQLWGTNLVGKLTRGPWGSKYFDDFVSIVAKARFDSMCTPPAFQELCDFMFEGVLHSRSSAFALTFRALVQLDKVPYVVVPLNDVEFVNLAHTSTTIDMTVVFKDFQREVLQICAIDLSMLAFIKRYLDIGDVKYYCNNDKLDWNSILSEIVECPEKFIKSGGWESYRLEDQLTLAFYEIASKTKYSSVAEFA